MLVATDATTQLDPLPVGW